MEFKGLLLSRRTLFIAIALFVLNALICRELFHTEYTSYLGSIEAAYIGISRYMIDHPFEFGWFPLWYGGIPFENAYPPLLHSAVALVAWIAGISPALSHHAVTATLYCLGPVALYLLALLLSRQQFPSFFAALLFSLVSPSIALVKQVESWAGSPWNPVRLHSLLEFGDGPHVSAVTLLPLALLALHHALERPKPGRVFLAAAALASVVLTNWLGAFALAIMVACYLLARSVEANWTKTLAWSAGIGAMAYGLAAPWIPPSNLSDIRHNAQHTIGRYPMGAKHILYAALVLTAVAVVWWLCRRLRASLVLSFGIYLTSFFGALVLADDWLGIQLMPQPHRYHLEFELAICLLAPFALAGLATRIPHKRRPALAVAAALALLAIQYPSYRAKAKEIIQPIDMTQTVDYQASVWLRDHFPHDRVFISGSIQFWLNAFADTQQVGGGFGQGIVNRQIPAVHYGIPWTIGDGADTAMWLRLFGAQAVVVSSPEGRDYYKQVWRDPAKFDGLLPELWRDGGDVIYGVPQRSASLAHVILPEHVPYRSPENNVDIAAAEPLAKALEDPSLPLAGFTWTTPSRASIQADLAPDHLLFVQVTYHSGWRAFVDGQPRRIRKDALGFMVVEPRCDGPCKVQLSYTGGLEALLARLLCGLTLLSLVAWAIRRKFIPAPVPTH